MNILITQRHSLNNYGKMIDSLENDYLTTLSKYDIHSFPVPNQPDQLKSFLRSFHQIDGLIISGGNSPSKVGEQKFDFAHGYSDRREKVERDLLKFAIDKALPVLGICHGFQSITEYFGGKINMIPQSVNHPVAINHPVSTSPGNHIFHVNSYHDYCVLKSDVPHCLQPFAVADGNITEGIYHKTLNIIAIQWHPERMPKIDKLSDAVLRAFVQMDVKILKAAI